MKPFDLEAFKAGQKALTRDGRVATFIGVCEECSKLYYLIIHIEGEKCTSVVQKSGTLFETATSAVDLVSMVSRHQALIDSYDPEDMWQVKINDKWDNLHVKPLWAEEREYRLHPHNDLIKAYKKGAKIECKHKDKEWRDASSDDIRYWYEYAEYRIKPEPESTYPIYKQSKFSGVVVEFTDLTTGKVLVDNDFYEVNYVQSIWIPHTDATQWQDWTPITKPEPTTHCLAYDAKRFDHEQTTAVRVRVVKKEVAEANGWHIIQEWEV